MNKNMKNNNHNSILLNRELCWLQFNDRVLQEAADERNPLIERIKFLGIYSNNLDEFFRIRVATIRRLISIGNKNNDYLEFNPVQTLEQITLIDQQQQEKFLSIYRTLLKDLNEHNIFIINENQLTKEQGEYVKMYFKNIVRPHIFPIMLKNFKNADAIRDTSIYLAIQMKSKIDSVKDDFAFLEVPTQQISRFLILPNSQEKQYIILLEDVIRYCLDDIFSIFNFDEYRAFTIKITRDSELDLDNDVSKSYIERIADSLKLRKSGFPVRIVYDNSIPDNLLKKVSAMFGGVKNNALMPGGRYHNFKDFIDFPNIGHKDLNYPPMPSFLHPELKNKKSILDVVAKKDIMIHFPYHSFQHIIDLLREASIDPNVKTIKMTIYRVARVSSVINALINASRNGKEVVVYLELQARFSEEQNIYWMKKLQDSGVKILQGIPGFKVHSKLMLIKRKENRKLKLYCNIGTGNFNEQTAPTFSDIGLLTSNEKIANEVDNVFNLFESYYRPYKFKTLVVAPFSMRKFVLKMLDHEIENAKNGNEAWAIIKLNNLVDTTAINKLYEASNAGVKITLIVRGICVLVPSVKNMSENIEAFSIVDRFLEHSRVYCFCNNGDTKLYISSSDWMIRNFDNRFEVACPIIDPVIKQDIINILKINIADNQKMRLFSDSYNNIYRKIDNENPVRAQYEIYSYLKNKSKT